MKKRTTAYDQALARFSALMEQRYGPAWKHDHYVVNRIKSAARKAAKNERDAAKVVV